MPPALPVVHDCLDSGSDGIRFLSLSNPGKQGSHNVLTSKDCVVNTDSSDYVFRV